MALPDLSDHYGPIYMNTTSTRRVIPIQAEPPDALRAAERTRVLEACALLKDRPGALLPILHAVQDAIGFVPSEAVQLIASELNLSRAEVHGVVTFYHYFRTRRGGRHVVHLCRAEACQALGAAALEAHAKKTLGIDFHATSSDGAVTLEPVYCLGNCALGPALMIDTELKGRVSRRAIRRVDGVIAGEAVMKAVRIFVPRDAAARSMGADETARAVLDEAKRRAIEVQLVRNGSRGMLWLEPFVEVESDGKRYGYGPVQASQVSDLFDNGLCEPANAASRAHALAHGLTEEIPYFKRQERLTFARVGIIDPVSIEDYVAHGGYAGLKAALAMQPAQIVESVTASGLRGRGGAAFPAGIKWKTVLGAPGDQKYIVCNADEGDSGTFSDRMLMEGDPLTLVEGMTIAGIATGATRGYIYLRWEYPDAHRALEAAIGAAYGAHYLGDNIQGSGKRFDLEVRLGAGAYICGEETSLLESLEGKRGQVRFKPPLPALAGLFGKPTVINNVITFASVPIILERGAPFYQRLRHGPLARHAAHAIGG